MAKWKVEWYKFPIPGIHLTCNTDIRDQRLHPEGSHRFLILTFYITELSEVEAEEIGNHENRNGRPDSDPRAVRARARRARAR